MSELLHNPYIYGALTGLAAAIWADRAAFQAWKTWDDFAIFDWKVASFRYVKGIIAGAIGSAIAQWGLTFVN